MLFVHVQMLAGFPALLLSKDLFIAIELQIYLRYSMACRYFTSNVKDIHFLINQTAPRISCVK